MNDRYQLGKVGFEWKRPSRMKLEENTKWKYRLDFIFIHNDVIRFFLAIIPEDILRRIENER